MAGRNNLTCVELLQPFSKLTSDVTLKDVDGSNHNVPSLHIILQDFRKDSQKLINQKVLLDRISDENCEDSDMVTKHYEKTSLDAPGFTPWFDVWMKLYLQSLPVVEQEYLKHQLGCVFVVSTQCAQPLDQFNALVQLQHRNQHDRTGASVQYFAPNVIKYFILIHDVSSGISEEVVQSLYTQVQNAFESNNCHLLRLNSRTAGQGDDESSTLADHWLQFSHRFSYVELRRGTQASSPSSANPVTSPRSTIPAGSPSSTATKPELIKVKERADLTVTNKRFAFLFAHSLLNGVKNNKFLKFNTILLVVLSCFGL